MESIGRLLPVGEDSYASSGTGQWVPGVSRRRKCIHRPSPGNQMQLPTALRLTSLRAGCPAERESRACFGSGLSTSGEGPLVTPDRKFSVIQCRSATCNLLLPCNRISRCNQLSITNYLSLVTYSEATYLILEAVVVITMTSPHQIPLRFNCVSVAREHLHARHLPQYNVITYRSDR